MFHVIEYARMGVGTKSMATLSTAYLQRARAYTRLRKQGADLAKRRRTRLRRGSRSSATPTCAAC
jgi:hypothetical protein